MEGKRTIKVRIMVTKKKRDPTINKGYYSEPFQHECPRSTRRSPLESRFGSSTRLRGHIPLQKVRVEGMASRDTGTIES
jgi:hypothetical protein